MPIVEALKREALREGLDISLAAYPHEPVDEALRRFAAARKHKLPAALEMLRAHLAWAKATDLPALRRASAAEVLGVAPEAVRGIAALFPHFHLGFDREGRPVTHIYGENYAAQQLFQAVPPERVGRFHVWRTERMLAAMYARRAAGTQPLPPGTLTAVVSVAGMTMRHVTKDFLALVKLLAVIDQNHYPERLGKMYIVGVSRLFFVVWRMVRPWLDAHTASKISFLTSEDAPAALQEAIDPSQLPETYGGMLPDPWGEDADTPPASPLREGRGSDGSDRVAPSSFSNSLAGSRGGGGSSGALAAALPRADVSPLRPAHVRSGGSRGSLDWGNLPPFAPSVGHHARGHSRSLSAEMIAAVQRRPGTPSGGHAGLPPHAPHHRRMQSDDVASVASFASAAVSLDESDTELFFDAVDSYVEQRLTEIEDASAAFASGTPMPPKRGGLLQRRGTETPARRLLPFDIGVGSGGSGAPPAASAASPTTGGLATIPEERVIKEVRSRLQRVRVLLDCTNVLTCITGVVLVAYGDSPFDPETLRVFGGVIMTVSLVSIVAGLAVSVSLVTLCLCVRDCIFGPRVVRQRTETEEEAAAGADDAV